MEFDYKLEDFSTTAPYEYILSISDPFQRNLTTEQLFKHALDVGFKTGFKKRLSDYEKSCSQIVAANQSEQNITEFEHSELELYTGEWKADDNGVYRYGANGSYEIACAHPIQPIEQLRNIDSGELKVKLQWRRGSGKRRIWSEMIVGLDTISNARNIVDLARIGISVASGKRAQNLVDYLRDVIDYNHDIIPEKNSVSRLGWCDEGFSPYFGDVVFDGSDSFERAFKSVTQQGDFSAWKEEVKSTRAYSVTARIVLAASFASVLVDKMGCLPFFVHLWGMDSGTGKTVGQMLAASVWGEPSPGGEYFKTFKSTSVGFEVMAGFFHSLPIVIDELQLAKDSRGRIMFNVYELASGSGKMRSNTKLGLSATPRWANCFITSGETPLTSENDGAGALNRVIEIECLAHEKVIENGHKTAETLRLNYGHAGKVFVEELLKDDVIENAKLRYKELFEIFVATKTTEKQAHTAALLVLADELATDWIFQDGLNITVEELSGFLKSKATVSASERGYSYMCDWVALNSNKFREDNEFGDVYGRFPSIDEESGGEKWVYIISSVFRKACEDAGINSRALLSQLRTKELIQVREKGFTRRKYIGNSRPECVILKLKDAEDFEDFDDGDYELI